LGLAVFGAAAVCTVVWLMILGRSLTFFYDEWDFINAAATTGYWHNVLTPHNGHPSMVPYSVYELLLHTVGLRNYWPYRLVLTVLDVGCGWLLFVLLRRKVHPVAAGAGAAALMLLGPAWQDLLWPFQIGFLGSVAGGLAALTLLDRDTRRADVGACACLLVSIACSGVGLPFLAGVAVELAWRHRSWRRLWVPVLPLALFVVWYETIGKSPASHVSPVSAVHSMASATTTAVGALTGQGTTVGTVLAVLVGVAIVVAVIRSPGRAARLAMAVSGLVVFWGLTVLARGVTPSSPSRYLYPAAAFILVAAAELPALIMKTPRGRLSGDAPAWARVSVTAALIGVVAYAGVAIWWNTSALTAGDDGLAGVSSQVRSDLGAVVLAGSALPGSFRPDQVLMPQVTVGPYLKAVGEFGSSGSSPQDILHAGNQLRANLDAMLLRGRPMEIEPVSEVPSILTTGDRCTVTPVGPGDPTPTIRLPSRGAFVTAPQGANLAVRVKSLSSTFPERSLATITAGTTDLVRWSVRPTAIRWEVELTPVPAPGPAGSVATVCPVVAPSGRMTLPPSGRQG
jgi:hypothetical protein